MTLLPIVDRELRVASRHWYTFWGRLGAAGLAMLIFFGLQAIAELSHGSFKAGAVQFSLLSWGSFLFSCAAGIFLTADALSEEKREGTLGLLFLTDLRGYDVVLGKFISHALLAFYGLIAVVPILGMTMLAGGVAGTEFWQSILVICNTLFLSLCAGLFVSSVSRDVLKAMNGTLFLMLLLLVGVFLGDWCIAGWDSIKFRPILINASPAYLFSQVGSYPFRDFSLCLGIQHALAWSLLIGSCVCTPRAWQDRSNTAASGGRSLSGRLRFGGPRVRRRFRRKWLARSPIRWLALRDMWLKRFIWCVFGVGLAVLAGFLIYFRTVVPLEVASYVQIAFGFGLLLWTASQASRFFVDGRRTGALELVLVTPTTGKEVIHNQWRALLHVFLLPTLVLVAVNVAGNEVLIMKLKQSLAKASQPTPVISFNILDYQIISLFVGVIKLVGNLVAVAWFGMWMGMTSSKTSIAVFKTICFVIVLPAIAMLFGQGVAMSLVIPVGMPLWMSLAAIGVMSLFKNGFFIVLARQSMFARFRETLLQDGKRGRVSVSRAAPPPMPPPPPVVGAAPGAA